MNTETQQLFSININENQHQPSGSTLRLVEIRESCTPVNLQNVQDFSNVCRVCATITELIVPIFSGEGAQHNLAEKINKYLPIEISDGDFLPQVVCYQCASQLLAWHEVVQCCIQADLALRSSISTNKKTEDVNKEPIASLPNPSIQENSQNQAGGEGGGAGTARAKTARCGVCNKSVAAAARRRHERVHGEKRYSCHACGRQFADPANLARHVRGVHERARPHACATCRRAFSRAAHLREHERAHAARQHVVCEACGAACASRAALRMHARAHAPARLACACGAQFRRAAELRAHRSAHEGLRAHACACGRAFRLRAQLTAHQRTHAPAPPPAALHLFAEYGHQSPLRRDPPKYSPTLRRCEFCNTRHLEPFYLEHLISTHAHRIFYCDECNRYKEKKDFMSHMSNHASQYTTKIKKVMKKNTNVQNKTETSVNQDNTSSGLATNKLDPGLTTAPSSQEQKTSKNNQTDDFSDHSDTEYGFGPLPESVFEAIEDSQDNQPETESVSDETNRLTPPAEKVTKKLHKKSRTCPICSKVYTASSSYFYHMKYTHKRIKEHECSICAKKFATRASLTTHTTTHTGECQFECKDCKKRFKSKASLYIHEQTHNGIKTWSCSQCNAAFRWRTHLLRHMKRHSSEKAHVCTTCGRRFNVRCDLLRHARTHAAGNYSCDKCNAKFAQVRYLKVHMNKKHSCNVTS